MSTERGTGSMLAVYWRFTVRLVVQSRHLYWCCKCMMCVNVSLFFFFLACLQATLAGGVGIVWNTGSTWRGTGSIFAIILAVYWQCSGSTSNTTVPMLHDFFMCVNVFCWFVGLFSLLLSQVVFATETLVAGVNIASDTGNTGRGNRSILGVYGQIPGGVAAVFYVAVRSTQLCQCLVCLMCVRVLTFVLVFLFVFACFFCCR